MSDTIERLDIGISLADAELEDYYYCKSSNNLTIKVKTWNAKNIEFIFIELIAFLDRGGNFIMDFCRNKSKNELFENALKKSYDIIPADIPYKLFQFLDLGNEPYLEIVCKEFKFKIL